MKKTISYNFEKLLTEQNIIVREDSDKMMGRKANKQMKSSASFFYGL